jgi:hypothetical protein
VPIRQSQKAIKETSNLSAESPGTSLRPEFKGISAQRGGIFGDSDYYQPEAYVCAGGRHYHIPERCVD